MRIGIDARICGAEHRGIGRYTESILRALVHGDHELVVFVSTESMCQNWLRQYNVKIVTVDAKPYSWAEQVHFLKILNKEKCDLVHFPHFNVPILYTNPYIVTVHDLILHHFPNRERSTLPTFIYWAKYIAYRLVLRNSIYRAKKVITVSEFTKEDILDHYNLHGDKINVVTESITHIVNQDYEPQQKIWYNKYQSYVLYVGSAYPHKNIANLVKAWKKVGPSVNKRLVLIIPKDSFGMKIETISAEMGMTDMVNGVSFIYSPSDTDLNSLYIEADEVITPSKYEGVGLPGLEALALGKSLLSSADSCLPEVYGKAARYFSTYPDQNLEHGIIRALKAHNKNTHSFSYKTQSESEIGEILARIYVEVEVLNKNA